MKKKGMLYLDSSVLVGIAICDPKIFDEASERIRLFEVRTSSELAIVECQSGLTFQLSQHENAGQTAYFEQNLNQLLGSLQMVAVSPLVLAHARALVRSYRVSQGLRSLDAVHVATANFLQQGLSTAKLAYRFQYLTADRRQHAVFSSEGHVGHYLGS